MEMDRNRELIAMYDSIGPAGAFGKSMIGRKIKVAENAMELGDTVDMLAALQELKDSE